MWIAIMLISVLFLTFLILFLRGSDPRRFNRTIYDNEQIETIRKLQEKDAEINEYSA